MTFWMGVLIGATVTLWVCCIAYEAERRQRREHHW